MADYVVVNPTESDVGVGTNATLDTDSSQGANAALIYTATAAYDGADGHAITVAIVAPADEDEAVPLSVAVTGTDIVITPEVDTDGSTILSTADEVKAAIAASTDASRLVTVADKAANDGSGVVSAFAEAALSGGSGGTVKKLSCREMTLTDAEVVAALAAGLGVAPESTISNHALRRGLARVLKYGEMRKL